VLATALARESHIDRCTHKFSNPISITSFVSIGHRLLKESPEKPNGVLDQTQLIVGTNTVSVCQGDAPGNHLCGKMRGGNAAADPCSLVEP
jgi:hypothetical protein